MDSNAGIKQEAELLLQSLRATERELSRELDTQFRKLTIRFGLMLVMGLGSFVAVLRLWSI
jgi:hypothetical protein